MQRIQYFKYFIGNHPTHWNRAFNISCTLMKLTNERIFRYFQSVKLPPRMGRINMVFDNDGEMSFIEVERQNEALDQWLGRNEMRNLAGLYSHKYNSNLN